MNIPTLAQQRNQVEIPPRVADRFYEALHYRYHFSPGATGTRLADELMTRPRTQVLDWPAPALAPNTVRDGSLVRPWVESYRYVHSYDKNAMYLAACSSVELGIAGLQYFAGQSFDKRLPGYWYDVVMGEWVMTPRAEYLYQRVDLTAYDEAWTWPIHGRALEPWYKRIRDARAELIQDNSEECRAALRLVKQMYTATIGLWGSSTFRAPDDPRYRPDWRHAIIAQATANMSRNIDKVEASAYMSAYSGYLLAWTDVDTLHFLSNEPNPLDALPAVLTSGIAPGQFKVKATHHAADVRDVWTTADGKLPTAKAVSAWMVRP